MLPGYDKDKNDWDLCCQTVTMTIQVVHLC